MSTQKEEEKEQVITPYDVEAGEGGVDYDKLIQKFGCDRITPELIERIEKATGRKAHRFLRRGIFFSHRDLDVILNCYESGKPFFLYTGRGPSSESLHLGHCIPFMFTQWLQEAFGVPLVIQITDDEKYIHKGEDQPLEKYVAMGKENVRDIIAFGFDPEKTFIFSDVEYMQQLYPNTVRVQKHVNYNQIKGIFGFNESDNCGKIAFPAVQAAPSFSNTFPHIFGSRKDVPCIIPQAIDQDPYFRMTRDIAGKLDYLKPACIHSQFIPALQGAGTKMSASSADTSIFVIDDQNKIKNKINKYAHSGGKATVEEHRRLGADLEKDISFQYLKFFLEDDEKLAQIEKDYGSGKMLSGEVKAELIKVVQEFLGEYQERRKKVTESTVKHFMSIRRIDPTPKYFKEGSGAQLLKFYNNTPSNPFAFPVLLTASALGIQLNQVLVTKADQHKYKAKLPTHSYPTMETFEGEVIFEKHAMMKYLCQTFPNNVLLGRTLIESAQVDQWLDFTLGLMRNMQEMTSGVFGCATFSKDKATAAKKAFIEDLRVIEKHLGGTGGRQTLVGNYVTVADIALFSACLYPFQLIIDGGARKAVPRVSELFKQISELDFVTKEVGKVKLCQKSIL